MIQKLTKNPLPKVIGYARVSTEEQHLDLQLDALNEAGCDRIFTDQGISGSCKTRAGFDGALDILRPGDTLVIWKMDRAFRSLKHALEGLEDFETRGVKFISLTEQIDTTTALGKCMYQIRNAFAELERNLISERTKAGLAAAKKRGVKLGRPRKLTPCKVAWAKAKLASNPNTTITSLAKKLGVSDKTLRRMIISTADKDK